MKELAVVVQYGNKDVTVKETIEAIKEANFKNVFVQWYDNKDWSMTQEEQVEFIKSQGLNIIFAHLGYQNINSIWVEGDEGEALVERYKRNIRECKERGIELVIMHLTSKHVAPMYNEIGLNRIKKITDYAKEVGVKVAFENTKIRGYLEYVFSNIDSDNIGLCYDAGHCHAHFDDEFNYEMFKDRIFAVHLHDNFGELDEHLLPFDGTINWEHVISKLKECNYSSYVTLELSYRNDYLKEDVKSFYKEGYNRGEMVKALF